MYDRLFAPRIVLEPEPGTKDLVDIAADIISMEYKSASRGMAVCSLAIVNDGLKYANDDRFKVGFKFRLKFGYPGNFTTEKRLIVTGSAPVYPNGMPVISLTAFDLGRTMMTSRAKCWGRLSSSEIAQKIASMHGLKSDTDQSKDWRRHSRMQPANISAFEYLDRLAGEIGYDFWIEGETLSFKILDTNQPPAARFTYYKSGTSILKDFSPSVRAASPPTRPTAGTNRAGTAATHANPTANGPRPAADLTNRRVGFDMGDTSTFVTAVHATEGPVTPTPSPHPEIQRRRAQAQQYRMEMRAVTASAETIGFPTLMARKIIQVDVTERRYSGLWRIEEATHSITADGGYTTALALSRSGTNTTRRRQGHPPTTANQQNNAANAPPSQTFRDVGVADDNAGVTASRTITTPRTVEAPAATAPAARGGHT